MNAEEDEASELLPPSVIWALKQYSYTNFGVPEFESSRKGEGAEEELTRVMSFV